MVDDFLAARLINQAAGGAVVAPWEICDLDECTLYAGTRLMRRQREVSSAIFDIEQIKNRVRREYRR